MQTQGSADMGRLWDDGSWGGDRCSAGDCCCGHWGDCSLSNLASKCYDMFLHWNKILVFRVILLSKWLQLNRSSSPHLKMSSIRWTPGKSARVFSLWPYLPFHTRCVKQHGQSGLTKACLESQISLEEAEAMVMKVRLSPKGTSHHWQFIKGDSASHSEREESTCW